jgi:glutamine synthetase
MATAYSVDEFEFIQLVIIDVHGVPKGRTMARRRMPGLIKHGLGIYGGICFFGIRDDINMHDEFAKLSNLCNRSMKPILSTLRPCPNLGAGIYKVGQVECSLEYLDGTLDTSTPRTATELVINRLQTELGLTVKSAFEMEFTIRETESKNFYGHLNKYCNESALESCSDLLFEMVHNLNSRGVPVDSLQTEFGPGQFEVTLDIGNGIQAPESTVNFKNMAKSFMKSKGYDAIFMTRVDPSQGASSGFHFNHSLWTLAGENAFLDASKPNKLSELGTHWLAGLVEHAPAMTVFCNPTFNCYRRLGAPFAPNDVSWSVNGRYTTFRLKVENGDNVYIENRLPSAACNPYLVFLATMAAGFDGVTRKLPLPKEFSKVSSLPSDLEGALKALEADTILTAIIGKKLVDHFCYVKRTFEVEAFADIDSLSYAQQLKKEQDFYLHNA